MGSSMLGIRPSERAMPTSALVKLLATDQLDAGEVAEAAPS